MLTAVTPTGGRRCTTAPFWPHSSTTPSPRRCSKPAQVHPSTCITHLNRLYNCLYMYIIVTYIHVGSLYTIYVCSSIQNAMSCAEPGARSKSQRTPLHLACIHRPQHKKGPKNGSLHEGARFNRALFVTLLAGYGADVEARDNKVGVKAILSHPLLSTWIGLVDAWVV